MRMRHCLIAAWISIGSGLGAIAQEELPDEARFQRAWLLELGEGKPEEALSLYQAVVDSQEVIPEIKARALFRVGVCHAKAGRAGAAQASFSEVINNFGEMTELVVQAQKRLAGETDSQLRLRRRVSSILKQRDGDSKIDQDAVISQLRSLGEGVIPIAFEVLERGPDYGINAATGYLSQTANDRPDVLERLIKLLELNDPTLNYLSWQLGTNLTQETLLSLVDHPSESGRALAASNLRRHPGEPTLKALNRLVNDEKSEVWQSAMTTLIGMGAIENPMDRIFSIDNIEDQAKVLSYIYPPSDEAQLRKIVDRLLAVNHPSFLRASIHLLYRRNEIANRQEGAPLSLLQDPKLADRIAFLYDHSDDLPEEWLFPLLIDSGHPSVSERLKKRVGEGLSISSLPKSVWSRNLEDNVTAILSALPTHPLGTGTLRDLKKIVPSSLISQLAEPFISSYESGTVRELIDYAGKAKSTSLLITAFEGMDRYDAGTQRDLLRAIAPTQTPLKTIYPGVALALQSPEVQVRKYANETVQSLAAPSDAKVLMNLVEKTPWPDVKKSALSTVAGFNMREADSFLMQRLRGEDRELAGVVSSYLRPEMAPELLKHLNELEDGVYRQALGIFQYVPSLDQRVTAYRTITPERSQSLGDSLLKFILADIKEHRLVSFRDLVESFIGSIEDITLLVSAADTYQEISDGPIPETIWALLSHPNSSARTECFQILAGHAKGEARDRLIETIDHETSTRAQQKMLRMVRPWQDPKIVTWILERGQSQLHELRRYPAEWYFDSLYRLYVDAVDPEKQQFLDKLMESESPKRLPIILETLRTAEDASLRQIGLSALADFPASPQTSEILSELLRENDPSIRESLRSCIERIREYRSTLAFLTEANERLAPINPMMDAITKWLQSPEPAVRVAAAKTLGELGGNEALSALVRHRKDKDPTVRQAIEDALDAISH